MLQQRALVNKLRVSTIKVFLYERALNIAVKRQVWLSLVELVSRTHPLHGRWLCSAGAVTAPFGSLLFCFLVFRKVIAKSIQLLFIEHRHILVCYMMHTYKKLRCILLLCFRFVFVFVFLFVEEFRR